MQFLLGELRRWLRENQGLLLDFSLLIEFQLVLLDVLLVPLVPFALEAEEVEGVDRPHEEQHETVHANELRVLPDLVELGVELVPLEEIEDREHPKEGQGGQDVDDDRESSMAVRVLEHLAVHNGDDTSVQEGSNEPDVWGFTASSKDIWSEPHSREGQNEQQEAL